MTASPLDEAPGGQMKICFVATVPYVVNAFLRDHLKVLSQHFSITLVTGEDSSLAALELPPEVRVIRADIRRQPSAWADFVALLFLWRLFRREQFVSVHTITPKAGLLGMASAFFAGIPYRLHHFTGQVWATRSGISRNFFKFLDRLTAWFSTRVFTDGHAQAAFLIREGVVSKDSVSVLGPGPICGVDVQRFYPDRAQRAKMRERLLISDNAIVILFVGRLHREKGLFEVLQAMEALLDEREDGLVLLLVGPSDDATFAQRLDALPRRVQSIIRKTGGVRDPESYMRAADIFVLPSHREGFGMVVLEAAASGLPSVVSDIYGLQDAVVDGVTALKVPVSAPSELATAIRRLVDDKALRKKMSMAAMHRVAEGFRSDQVTDKWRHLYAEIEAEAEAGYGRKAI